jgi:hypothetical protein
MDRRVGVAAVIAIVTLAGTSLATSQLAGVGLSCGLGNVVETILETGPESTTYATPDAAATSNDWLDVHDVPIEARTLATDPGHLDDGIREIAVAVPGDSSGGTDRHVYLVFVGGDDVIELHVERTGGGRYVITGLLQC